MLRPYYMHTVLLPAKNRKGRLMRAKSTKGLLICFFPLFPSWIWTFSIYWSFFSYVCAYSHIKNTLFTQKKICVSMAYSTDEHDKGKSWLG